MNKTIVIGLILSAMTALMALITWMFPLVAEYPGVERSLGNQLPSWFMNITPAGESSKPSSAASAKGNEKESGTSEQGHEGEEVGHAVITGTEVEVSEREYRLEPSQITLHVESLPATVTFVLHNQGRFSHDFHVEGHGLDSKAPKFGPGKTIRFEVTFAEEGEYEISCPLSNHAERGMRGTLIVQIKR